MAAPVRIVPLGGLGEIGMNCMAVECDGRIAVVDCGVLFPNENLGVDLIAPDLSWLRERREQVGAVFLTHGHEDHLGALPFLLREIPVPVYGTRFTLALLRPRLEEAGVRADLREVRPGDVRPAGEASPIAAEFLAVTHSIPDACGLALSTPQGTLLHSGDFKIDPAPVRGPGMDLDRIEALGRKGVRLLLSDSTNAEREGTSLSESEVGPALEQAFERARGRVFVACFASNVHRLQQIVDAARAFGRRVAFLGRSMEANARLAQELGYLELPAWMPVSPEEARTLPPRELCVLTTGTQGEPRSALARLARGEHPDLAVAPGDLVVLSSRFIPGNEIAIGQVVNELCRRGAEVAYEGLAPLHVSGHAQADEQRRLIRLARPAHFVPIHGEYRHLSRHAAHAAAEGVAGRDVLVDGQVLELADAGVRVLEAPVATGRVYTDRDALLGADMGALVVRDRRLLAETGLCIAVLAIERTTGAVVRGPELFARGVAGFEGAEEELRGEVLAALAELSPQARTDPAEVQEAVRLAVRRFFRRTTGKKPPVLPVVLEL
ncbi:ribonuclease J [Anaeromyxobacter dehalogenans]|uniref:Ribonuclease J n=1 Tax=Anaeromyxobacter dehalogenans (strain 2CP-C) TaxID=290397 RepID=Q2IM39_ANADE|nr:ribonuclease J [Anaeromyxobacter dehalogenans]ABC79872.1 Beta-lactamase-like protein [Anaeromyxobacter dehalogenans 2CP-C]